MMMNLRYISWPFNVIFLAFVFAGCFQSDYTKLVREETDKNVRYDSILLGLQFRHTKNEFYGRCFDLNKAHLISQGPNNSSVEYLFTDSLFHQPPAKIRLLFYPTFDNDDRIKEMLLEFSYAAWAPWNTQYQSDALQPKVKQLLLHWYSGNGFVTATTQNGNLPVKLDGNRRVLVYRKDAQTILVKVQDIFHPDFEHSKTSSIF